jgi:hypothetical protein
MTEQMALGSSPGLAHYPKMELLATSFQEFLDHRKISKLGPAGPIAVNDPAAKIRGTSCKGTPKAADRHSGRMSPSAAGVASKPRIQRPGKFTCEATKGKGKDDKSWPAPSYLAVRQELPFDSDS